MEVLLQRGPLAQELSPLWPVSCRGGWQRGGDAGHKDMEHLWVPALWPIDAGRIALPLGLTVPGQGADPLLEWS